jgi:DNA-binding transcriptional regulator PaaX
MKNNAQKILLLLCNFPDQTPVLLTKNQLFAVVPEMTAGGFRSLLRFLEQKGWLSKENLLHQQLFSLTEQGREALIARFPALNQRWLTWKGEWQAMVFLSAPKTDSQFRYLRQLVLSHHSLQLSRGVYLAAGGFDKAVLVACETLYQHSVVIFSVANWEFGLDRPIISKYYDLASIAAVYSSISSTTDQMLANLIENKLLTDQQKFTISTTIDRLCQVLKEDPGFTSYYFPGLLDLPNLLKKIRRLI